MKKLLPKQASLGRTTTVPTKRYNPGDKVFFKAYSNNTSSWELGTIEEIIRNTTYIILGPTARHKRHLNQIRRRRLDDPGRTPQDEEEAIDTLYDTFDIEPPQAAIEQRRSGRKRKFTEPLTIDFQKRRYWHLFLTEQKSLGGGCYGDISYHTPKMNSSNLKIFSLEGDNFSFLTRHLTDGLQAEHG